MWFFVFLFFIPFTLLYIGLCVVAVLYLAMAVKQLTLHGHRFHSRTGLSAWAVILLSISAMGMATLAYFRYIWFW